MGRAFEYRKARKLKRWGNMSRTFTRIGKEITIAAKHGGTLGTQGSLSFMFDHKSVFKIKPKEGVSLEDLELELIDYGVDELEDIVDEESGDEQVVLYGAFEEYSNIQKYLEDNGFEIISSEFERIPHELKEVTAEQRVTLEKLLEKFEDDEDVQNVFHNMKEEDGDAE